MDFRSGAQRVVKRTRALSTFEEERTGSCLQHTSTCHALHQVRPIHMYPRPRRSWKRAACATPTAIFGTEIGTPLVFVPHFRAGMDHWDPLVADGLGTTAR